MQGVAKFVEHGDRIIPRNIDGLAFFSGNKVRIVRHDGADGFAMYSVLFTVVVHPRTRIFSWSCEGVKIPKPDKLTVFGQDFVNSHRVVINRNIMNLHKLEAKQLS